LRPAIKHLGKLSKEHIGMRNLRELLVEKHGEPGRRLAMELEHESSRLYKPVGSLITRVSIIRS